MRSIFTPIFIFLSILLGQAQQILPGSELKNYHPVTISLYGYGESYSETTGNPNPFLDRRLNVTFTSPSSTTYVVPGYYSADGNAAETTATTGNIWHVKFTPDEEGQWSFSASFREGTNVAITTAQAPSDGVANTPIDGQSGNFTIIATDKTGVDFRGKGKLKYTGEHFMKWSGTGDYFLEFGADSPEVFLEYDEFDNTPTTRDYDPQHSGDWQTGDPIWQTTKGKGIIGVVNYLSNSGMNVHYFLTMNIEGDGKDAYPYVTDTDFAQYDVSKTAQWGIVFDHMMAKGVMPEFVLTENENQSLWESDEGVLGGFADGRKLYYREMVARFGYLNAIAWNIGEEIAWNTGGGVRTPLTNSQQEDFANYLKALLPNPEQIITIHNGPNTDDSVFTSNLGDNGYNSISFQGTYSNDTYGHDRILYWVNQSASNSKPWVVRYTEPFVGGTTNQDIWRKESLWASLTAGGAGVQYYDGGGRDLTTQDYSTYDTPFAAMKNAYDFYVDNDIPFWEMSNNDGATSSGWMMSKTDEYHVLYFQNGGSANVNFGNSGDYIIKWYDPRNGGTLQDGSVTSITADGTSKSIGTPPSATSSDWVLYAMNVIATCTADYEEDNGLVIIEAENIPLVAGWNIESATTGFTGTGYINWTGGEFFSTPGNGTISTTIKINTPGTYLFEWRNKIGTGTSTTDNNDSWVRFNDASEFYAVQGGNTIYPKGSGQTPVVNGSGGDNWFKVYSNAISWNWQTRTNDNSPYAIYVDFDSPGTYTMEISGRSENHFIDRIVLSASGNEDLGLTETLCDGNQTTSASITIDDLTITEGTDAVFTVSLDNAVSGGFTVDFSTANNSATAGEDYTANTGTLTFAGTAGETQTITIATTDDALVESIEDFFVNLTNATNNVTIGDAQGIATLTDNDIASNITIDDLTITEGTDAVFTVSLDNAVAGGFSIDFATANNSATAGEDYSANTGTLTFAGTAGETQSITIATTDDALVESNEDFFVNLTNATNGVTIGDAQGIATITDNDIASNITIDDLTITEGTDAVFTVSLDNAVSGGFSVDFATANNSATAGEDYTANTGTLTFAGTAGETQTITIATTDDALVESNEDFFVNLTNVTNGVTIADAQGIATILDNDAAASIFIDDLTITEGTDAVFTVSLDNAVTGGFTVDFATANNSATAGEDYTANTGTLTFAGTAGETQTITIATTDDALVESNEDFFVNLTNATNNVTIGDAQGIATLTDNDIASNITIDDLTITEGTDAVFTVSLDNAVTGGFSVDFATANNSATAGEDYSANTGTLTFAGTAGETQSITIATTDDSLVESNEDFFVNLTNATNGVTIGDAQGIATITDNDIASNITIDNLTITEGNDALFTVSLDNAVSGGFTVDFATANNSATAAEDYTANTGTLTFAGTAGETQTITIATTDDALVESNEDFFVNLTNATNGVTIADAQGTATISDNDSENEIFPTIDISDAAAEEGNIINFPVTLSTAPTEDIELAIGFVNISTTDADYDSSPQTLVFLVGQTEQNIEVALINDQDDEEEESFEIIISEVIRGSIENPDETAIGNIFEASSNNSISCTLCQ